MKKSFKFFAVAIAATITIGTLALASCNKDEYVKSSNVSSASSMVKGSSSIMQIRNKLVDFYGMCDNAYHNNPTSLIEICANNDSASFLSLTGITMEQINEINSLCERELEMFIKDHPELEKEETPCGDCVLNALPNLGTVISMTEGNTAILVPSSISGDNYWRLMMCELQCSAVPSCGHAFCLTSCMGKYLMSYEGIKKNHSFSIHMWDGAVEYTTYKEFGSNLYAVEEIRNNMIHEYMCDYSDENEFDVTLVDTNTLQLFLDGTIAPFILENIKQHGDSTAFDLYVANVYLASYVLYTPNGEKFLSIMTGNSKAVPIGPIAKELGKMIIRGGMQFGIEKAFESIFGGGSSSASECYAHMESLSRICVDGGGLPQVQHRDKHINCFFDCKKKK